MFLSFNAHAAAQQPFRIGETIYYKIHKLALRGDASLVYKGPRLLGGKKKTVLIVFTSKGFNFYDQEVIYLEPEDFRPVRVERNINIFGKRERIFEDYFDDHIQITKIDRKGKKSEQRLDIKHKVDNIYGLIYRYRLKGSFQEGDTLDMHLPTKDVSIKLVRKEQVEAGKKNFDAYYLESTPSQVKLWFDVGPHKIPLRISGDSAFGDTVMIMRDYKE